MSPNNAVETDARLRLAPLTANVRHTEESVKPHTKAAAVTAVKWAAGLSAGFILGPIVMGLASGTAAPGKLIAEKLIVGLFWFPILFFGLWAWGVLTKKNPVARVALDSKTDATETPPTANKAGIHVSQPPS